MSRERLRRMLTTSTSMAVALAMGGGLFALVTDTAESAGNTAVSGELATAPTLDLKIAEAIGGSCDSVVWGDGPIGAAISTTVDMNAPTWTEDATIDICLRNDSGNAGFLELSFADVLQSEVGACGPNEAAEDTTCADGAEGELSGLLLAAVEGTCPGAGSGSQSFSSWTSGPQHQGVLASQTSCLATLRLERTPATPTNESQRSAAQTDRVEWDVVFGLANPGMDVEAEPNNEQAQANVMGTQITGSIDPAGDVDWFEFDHAGDNLQLGTAGLTNECAGDTYLELYDAVGTLLAFNDDTAVSVCSQIVGTYPAGVYYAKVRAYQASATFDNYVLYH